MKERVLYDPGQPIPIRRYTSEVLAALDQSLLENADIPAFIHRNRYGEVDIGAAVLMVRREHVAEALQVIDAAPAANDSSITLPPNEEL
jgi:hypothetical protein